MPFRSRLFQFTLPKALEKCPEALKGKIRFVGEIQRLFALMQDGNVKWIKPAEVPKILDVNPGNQFLE